MKGKLSFRVFLFLIIGIFVSIQTVQANPITRQQALQHAHEFLQQRGMNLQQAPLRHVPVFKGGEVAAEKAPYYVFNIGSDNGFVIAAGDDCAYEILGYADKGHFEADNIPDGMRFMLDFYAEQISYASKSPKVAKPKSTPTYPAVEPMLTCEWGQEEPYNDNCPISPSTGERCVTGCVATAMAQVMYYHRNHQSTREVVNDIPSYGVTWIIDGVPKGSPIDWDNMLDTYDSTATEVQRQAVANLMLYCGTAVRMGYSPTSSGAYSSNVVPALVNYFDYCDDASLEKRDDYTDAEWETLIYEELGAGYPIYYSGSAHAYVVDGHDGNGFVHINWGWDGTDNGNFRLTPTNGSGGSMGGYSSRQNAVFGAAPDKSIPRLSTTSISIQSSYVVDSLSSLTSIPVSLGMRIANLTDETHTFEYTFGLYKHGDLPIFVSGYYPENEFAAGASRYYSMSFDLESMLTPGVYTFVPLSRVSGSNQWRKNNNPERVVTMLIYGDAAHFKVGPPQDDDYNIKFACDEAKSTCVQNWDLNHDGELSFEEAAAVTSLDGNFCEHLLSSFDELQYFTGLTEIAPGEFSWCENLTSVIIPPNVTSIGDGAFNGCSKLQHITIPKNVTSIGEGAFWNIEDMREIRVDYDNPVYDSRGDCNAIIETETRRLIVGGSRSVIPDDVLAIAPNAFSGCTGLESIQIPESVTDIGEYAFNYCTGLTTVDFWADVIIIDRGTFEGCESLTSLTIPFGVTSIGEYAFNGCKGLTSITIPSSVTNISQGAFLKCNSLTNIMIPPSVAYMSNGAFGYCSGLTSITIPASVKAIYGNPFYACTGLQHIVVDADNSYYESDGHNTAIIETATKKLVTGLAHTVIPADVLAIGPYAFYSCSGLTSIVIPEGVTSIGSYAFRYSGLTSATLSSSVTRINDYAFSDCSNLQSTNIPYGVTYIGMGAFYSCKKMTSITIPSTVTFISNYAFLNCTSLTSVRSYVTNVFSTGTRTFHYCPNATLYVPEGLVEVYQSTPDWNSISSIEEMPIIHDVNGDGSINIADVTCLIDGLLSTSGGQGYYYDINNDEFVNITDVTALIDAILGS